MTVFFFSIPPAQTENNARNETPALGGTTITLASGEYPPFFSEKLKDYGVVSQLVKESFARMGVEVRYVFLPWRRGLEEAARGRWDGTFGWQRNDESLKRFHCSDPIVRSQLYFFQRVNTPVKWKTIDDLKDVRIGLTCSDFYGDEFHRAEEEGRLSLIHCLDAMHCLRMLVNGRLDLVGAEINLGHNLLITEFKPEESALVEPQSKALRSTDLFLMLSRQKENSGQLMQRFNEGLRKLKADN